MKKLMKKFIKGILIFFAGLMVFGLVGSAYEALTADHAALEAEAIKLIDDGKYARTRGVTELLFGSTAILDSLNHVAQTKLDEIRLAEKKKQDAIDAAEKKKQDVRIAIERDKQNKKNRIVGYQYGLDRTMKKLIAANLRDPNSFKFISGNVYVNPDGTLSVVWEYTATNAFGGIVSGTALFKVTDNPWTITLVAQE